MVKWTSLDPYLECNESDSQLYTHFEFCEERNHRDLKNMPSYEAREFMMTKKFQEKLTYFRRLCKWCASR